MLKTDDAPDTSHPNPLAKSGYVGNNPPAPKPPPVVTVNIDTSSALSHTRRNYLCWNIDASRNREFFDRNLDPKTAFGKQVALQAKALAPPESYSLLRFGGSGNDYLTYEFNGTKCPPQSEYKECMNQTLWGHLLDFTEAANAKMIFGLSMNTGHDYHDHLNTDDPLLPDDDPFPQHWDPTNARAILTWTIAQKRDGLIGELHTHLPLHSHVHRTPVHARCGASSASSGASSASSSANFRTLPLLLQSASSWVTSRIASTQRKYKPKTFTCCR
jgi:hypothetical protein